MRFARRVRSGIRRRLSRRHEGRKLEIPTPVAKPQPRVRCVYAGVLDGDALWLALRLPAGVRHPVVRLRSRATDEYFDVPSQLTGERILEVCSPVVGLDAPWDMVEGIYDLEILADSDFRARAAVRESAMAPVTPTTTPPSSDRRWSVLPYRTRNGLLSVRFTKVATGADVQEVRAESSSVVVRGFLFGESLASQAVVPVTELLLRRRHDNHELVFPCAGDSRRFSAIVDPELIYAASGPSTSEVWNVYVTAASMTLRVGRRTSDIERVQLAIRYPTTRYPISDGGVLKLRPYYSNGRFLALETHAERIDGRAHESVAARDKPEGTAS